MYKFRNNVFPQQYIISKYLLIQGLRIRQVLIEFFKKNVGIKLFFFQQGMVTQSPVPTQKTQSQVTILWKILLYKLYWHFFDIHFRTYQNLTIINISGY